MIDVAQTSISESLLYKNPPVRHSVNMHTRCSKYSLIGAFLTGVMLASQVQAASLGSATAFGGVIAGRTSAWDGQNAGVAVSLLKILEVETGAFFTTFDRETVWYGQASLRLPAPSKLARWLSPYAIFGTGFYGSESATNGGFGLTIGVVRLDYRYLWVDRPRRGISRVYLGLEFEFGR